MQLVTYGYHGRGLLVTGDLKAVIAAMNLDVQRSTNGNIYDLFPRVRAHTHSTAIAASLYLRSSSGAPTCRKSSPPELRPLQDCME